MSKDRQVLEKRFKEDILEVMNREYSHEGRYSMNMKWKADVLIDIWGDIKREYGYV